MNNSKAVLIIRDRIEVAERRTVHVTIWRVARSVVGSTHPYKYSLAFVVDGVCVLRYGNEAGKGDHRHYSGSEKLYEFTGIGKLLRDFMTDIERWTHEEGVI